ncbi:c-5 sterol desaturase [Moniliophthora roreri MCA 2997]|uniref:C-5 sterol desaturase n=2 Tax=Moniliophthora roreri TaxID=221103 RepID=V2YAH3_MONRO|nr:c-5 sterol desaturase [Moniliophthora roreri MCA 2997]
MDLILQVADDVLLDKVWASVLPLQSFQYSVVNATSTTIPIISSSSSKWSQLVSHLPHPQISMEDYLYEPTFPYSHLTTFPDVSAWPRSYIPRQIISISVITLVGIHLLYFLFASLSYYFIFNHDMMRHPRFLKNQVRLEIQTSLKAFPVMTLLTLPFFQGEVMGWTKLYDGLDTYGYTWLVLSVPCFLLFTDYCIYWIHRWLHIPSIYKALHKPHHKWIVPTPFASHAFHPVDGWAQSVPYHLFVFLFPMHRALYLVLFVCVNFWSIFIHDSDMITGHPLEKIINGPAHHTLHHLYFTVNYGQYFTWADRVGNSYRHPDSSLDPLLEVKMKERAEQEENVKSKDD